MNISHCPRCRARVAGIDYHHEIGYRVVCNCGATGAFDSTPTEAILSWNEKGPVGDEHPPEKA